MNGLVGDSEQLTTSSKSLFDTNKERYCREYVEYHVRGELDESFVVVDHYLDKTSDTKLLDIKKNCLTQYEKGIRYSIKQELQKIDLYKEDTQMNLAFYQALQKISVKDQEERKKGDNLDWDIQNRLDAENRVSLDSLVLLYGFPTGDQVTIDGFMSAFMIMHHSTDCEWNKKWVANYLAHKEETRTSVGRIFSFYFYRNFNPNDGGCKEDIQYLEDLKKSDNADYAKELLDFTEWDKIFGDK